MTSLMGIADPTLIHMMSCSAVRILHQPRASSSLSALSGVSVLTELMQKNPIFIYLNSTNSIHEPAVGFLPLLSAS